MFILTEYGSQRKDPLVDGRDVELVVSDFLPVEFEVTVVFLV